MLRNFASLFMRNVCLRCSVLVIFFPCQFLISELCWPLKWIERFSFSSVLWKSSCMVCILPLMFGWIYRLNHLNLVFFVGRFLINYLISLTSMTIQMFYLFLCQAYVQYVIVSLFVQLKIILFSIVNSTLIHSLFTSFCFLFKELGIVQFICYSFLFNSAVVREYILYDFSSRKCVESCFRPSK